MPNRFTALARRALTGFALLALASAAQAAAPPPLDEFFEQFTDEWVAADPDLATGARYFSGERQRLLERQLTPRTRQAQLQRIERARQGLATLAQYDQNKLDDSRRVSVQLMQWLLQSVVNSEAYLDLQFPLNQFNGANVTLVESLSLRHPLATAQDADNYLARLQQLGPRMLEAVQVGQELAGKNLLPPRFIAERTLQQLQDFVAMPLDSNPLIAAYDTRMQNITDLGEAQRKRLRAEATEVVKTAVYPAWQQAITLMQGVLPRTTDAADLSRFEDGASAYAHALRQYTTTSLTAEQIHEIGLQQVARIEAEMDRILKSLGRSEGPLQARINQLRQDLAYPDPTSDASRAAIMKDIDGFMADALKRSPTLFDLQPRSPVIAQPFPRFREASAAANYNRAPLDGSRPAIFQMPLRPQRMTRFGLRTLVYHEAIPGHHFQIALEQENTQLPRFRQARVLGGISAFSEGWALYAENLVAEHGWYEGDPEGLLGMLDAQLFRARRLVVDTGLHAKGWSRQQAIDYGLEPSEIERYVVMPGQACAYMIGQLEILRLRDRAREALGDKFSLRDFHNLVLTTGTVPLELLGTQIDSLITAGSE